MAQGLDRPTAEAWPATRSWDAAAEREFGEFVAAIGRGVAARRCAHLSSCLNNPAVNPLHEAGARRLRFRADCADVPYTLRAYFAYRRGLPFAYSAELRGRGRDRRYMSNTRPVGLRRWTDFATPRALIESIGSDVHTGYFRSGPEIENSDTYPIAVERGNVRPGTVYYDPNGHALIVYEVRPDGEVLMFDGHPDNSLSHPRLTERYALGPARMGGGFRNFRPIAVRNGAIVQTPNAQLRDFGGATQYDRARWSVAGHPVDYYSWVRLRLATDAAAAQAAATRDVATARVRHAERAARAQARAQARAAVQALHAASNGTHPAATRGASGGARSARGAHVAAVR